MSLGACLLCLTLGGASMEPVAVSPADAVRLAVPAANAALDRAYASFAKRPGVVAPARTKPWVAVEGAAVVTKGDGFVVSWHRVAPAGYEFEARVAVDETSKVTVTKASASFSPD